MSLFDADLLPSWSNTLIHQHQSLIGFHISREQGEIMEHGTGEF